jgi:hypothetical protein
LSNVTLKDDKCAPMRMISGDTNHDSKLDTSETWTYTCRTNLSKTTTNTAIATGMANGFTVKDVAIATVPVAAAVPKLPNTGVAPAEKAAAWPFVAISVLMATLIVYVIRKRETL